eukprot:1149254-Pelagomonas_calceolata.AAC.3
MGVCMWVGMVGCGGPWQGGTILGLRAGGTDVRQRGTTSASMCAQIKACDWGLLRELGSLVQ